MNRAAGLGALVAATVAVVGCLDTSIPVCGAGSICVASTTMGGTSSSGSGSTSSGSSSGTTSLAASSSGSTGSTSASSSSSGNTGSSSGGSSSGATPAGFAGEWDTNFAHVSLAQDGGVVWGQFHDWGYTYLDPTMAGTIAGTVQGNVFNGTYQDHADGGGPLTWTLLAGQLAGTYGPSANPWCGVTAGQNIPLPTGCGWSDLFPSTPSNLVLQQVADEVTGTYQATGSSSILGSVAGVVSDMRVNGRYYNAHADLPGRFSWSMTPDGTQFAGNYFVNATFSSWCGVRQSSTNPIPSQCMGGGGTYDGTWFTNLGTITLSQPVNGFGVPSTSVTGVWFWWGGETEYPIGNGVVSGPGAGPSNAYSLDWTDSSPLAGAVGMTSLTGDPNGLTLQGQVAIDGGGLWCGVSTPTDPSLPDAGQIGTLYTGCGLTNNWNLSGNPQAPPVVGQFVQNRGTVTGFTDSPFDLDVVSGNVGFNALARTGASSWTLVTGSWSDSNATGEAFTWYPDGQDQSFVGDFTAGGSGTGAWCGSVSGAVPSLCGPPDEFGGEWDTNFAHVSLTQNEGLVTGSYRYWGYTYSDLKNAGTISGTVLGNVFQGSFQDNNGDPAVPLTWTLSPGQLNGTYQISGQPPYPWCGVPAGQGIPLPTGCGWSDSFSPMPSAITLQQIADQVTGSYSAPLAPNTQGILAGVVSDFRLNGRFYNTVLKGPGRFSFWMTPDGTAYSGNYYVGSHFNEWCGGRVSTNSPTPPKPLCPGGGGLYDGTWFTNLGTVTLTQPQSVTLPVTGALSGIWFGWGSETEYAIDGVVAGPADGGPSTRFSLSWSDSSPLGGAVGVTSLSDDIFGLTLQGHAVDGGGLWCGGTDPYPTFRMRAKSERSSRVAA